MRAIWRVRSRSMASVGAVHVRARAIAFPRRVEEPLRPSPPAPPLGTCCKAQETVVEGEALLIPSPLPRSSRARSRGAPVRPREPSPAAQTGRARRGPTTPRRVRFRPPSRHLGGTLRCLSQPTQCDTLGIWRGGAPPPFDPPVARAPAECAGGGLAPRTPVAVRRTGGTAPEDRPRSRRRHES